jgi:thiamine transporter ThiT
MGRPHIAAEIGKVALLAKRATTTRSSMVSNGEASLLAFLAVVLRNVWHNLSGIIHSNVGVYPT